MSSMSLISDVMDLTASMVPAVYVHVGVCVCVCVRERERLHVADF